MIIEKHASKYEISKNLKILLFTLLVEFNKNPVIILDSKWKKGRKNRSKNDEKVVIRIRLRYEIDENKKLS